jgi:hypothetical protein
MDVVGLIVAAVAGGLGAGPGAFLAQPIDNRALRMALTAVCFVAMGAVGRTVVAPWAFVEFAFLSSPSMEAVVKLAPDHIGELKETMRDIYRRGGATKDYERAGVAWGRKYAGTSLMVLMLSRNEGLALRSFETYLSVFGTVKQHSLRNCFDWLQGTGSHDMAAFGLGPDENRKLVALAQDAQLLARPENAPVTGQTLPADLAALIGERVRKNWDAARLDFEATGRPSADMSDAVKEKVCYTDFAVFSEVQALPPSDRVRVLRGMFGGRR